MKDLEEKIKRLERELNEAKDELHASRIDACGVKIGDIVTGTHRHAGRKYRVVEIDPTWSPPWLKGNPERADGSFGTAKRALFDNWTR